MTVLTSYQLCAGNGTSKHILAILDGHRQFDFVSSVRLVLHRAHHAHGCTEFAENYQVQLRPCHLAAVAPKVKDVVESEALGAQTTFVT